MGPCADDSHTFEFEEAEEFVAQYLATLKPTAPGIIRSSPASQALRRLGLPLRGGRPDVYRVSKEAKQIQTFWSHSWQDSTWRKILALLWLHNALPAALISTFGALVAAALTAAGFLPTGTAPSAWSAGAGCLLYALTFVFWQPRGSIFLDILCVDQKDQGQKMHGLLSMGAVIRQSDAMLVLWDPTYVHRLWCVFEVAAFLHSRPQNTEPALSIRPVVLGPSFMLITLTSLAVSMAVAHVPENERITTQVVTYVVGCYVNVCMHREYFRTVDILEDDLLNFKSEKTSCHCCSVNHVDAAGDALLCDKHVLTRCISLWFGSMEHFDALVRSTVGECLTQQLSKDFRGYWSCVMATIPAVWVAADVAAFQWLRLGSFQPEVARVVGRILAWMLGVQPCLLFFSLRAARVFRRRRRYEAVVNLLILCGPLTAFVAAFQMEKFYLGLVNRLPEEHRLPYYATILLGLTWLPVAALLYRYIGVHPRKAQPVDDEISLGGHMLPRPPAATVGAALEGHTLEGHTSPVESNTILSL